MYELRAARQAQDQPGTFLDWYLGRRGGQGAGAVAGPAAAVPGAVVPPDAPNIAGLPTQGQVVTRPDVGLPEILPDTPQGTFNQWQEQNRGRTPETLDPRSRLQFDPTIPPSQIVEDRDRLEFDPTLGPDPRSRLQFDPTIPSSQVVEDRSRLEFDPTLGPDPRSRLRTDPIVTPEPDPRSRLRFDPTIPPLQVPPLPEDRSRLEFDPTLEPDPRERLQFEVPEIRDNVYRGEPIEIRDNVYRGEPFQRKLMIGLPSGVSYEDWWNNRLEGMDPDERAREEAWARGDNWQSPSGLLPQPVRAPRPEMPTMPQPVGGLPPEVQNRPFFYRPDDPPTRQIQPKPFIYRPGEPPTGQVQLRGPEDRSRLEFDPTLGPDPRGRLRVEAPSPSAALWGGDTTEGEDRSRLQREVPIQSRAPSLLNAPINAFADFLRNHPGGGQGLLSQSLPALMRANPNAWAQIQASPSRQREIEQLAQGIPGLSPVEARARASRLRKLLGVYSGEEEEG